jgi:hypothetical protein
MPPHEVRFEQLAHTEFASFKVFRYSDMGMVRVSRDMVILCSSHEQMSSMSFTGAEAIAIT